MRIERDRAVLVMSAENQPEARCESGGRVVFSVTDGFGGQLETEDRLFHEIGWDRVNPATGPLFVEGAEPGDILKVTIEKIELDDVGVMVTVPGLGALGDFMEREITKLVPIRDGYAHFRDDIALPISPMIGVIGTAPEGEPIPTGTPGLHGGNMDCSRIVEGAVVYLPVNTPGGLLSLGDLHAVMADGEVVVCGVEIGGEVTLSVDVIKGQNYPLPLIVSGEQVITVASEKTLDEAARLATENMHKLLCQTGIELHEAAMLMSLVGQLRICQIVDPLMTARMEIPVWVLEKQGYSLK